MKRLCYISEVENKISVKVTKLNKNLNIMIDFRRIRASFRNYFDMRKIHAQIILVNKKVKIFDFSLKEFVLFEIDVQLCML